MILLLIVAIAFWLVAGIPGVLQIPALSGKVDFGWAGMFLFGLWILLGGGLVQSLVARIRRPASTS